VRVLAAERRPGPAELAGGSLSAAAGYARRGVRAS
jgi:hypothetical protein